MVIDAHYHLDERIETVDSLLAQMQQHGIDRVALIPTMVDPFQVGKMGARFAALARKLVTSRWRGLGLRLYKATVTADGQFSLLGKTYPIYDRPDNESVARVMQMYPDKFYGWVFVNPSAADPLAEVQKWAGQPGWIGISATPFGIATP